jgi:hypothetical protein
MEVIPLFSIENREVSVTGHASSVLCPTNIFTTRNAISGAPVQRIESVENHVTLLRDARNSSTKVRRRCPPRWPNCLRCAARTGW